ncbi:MAG: sulfatase [Rikenellaceae bacterium]
MKNQILFTALGASLVAGCSEAKKESAIPERPNILWIMSEDMGQDLSCYGMPAVSTPTLDKMASEGVQYNAGFTTNPISSPSRSAMMTGVYQTQIDAHNHRSNRDVPLTTDVQPITYHLRNAGYTCILGHKDVMRFGQKIDCNFKHKPIGEWDGVNEFGLFDKVNEITAEDQPFFAQVQMLVTHRGDWWNEITANAENPVNPADVVLPEFMPDDPLIRKEWASYLDQVQQMDKEVNILLEDLKAKGVLDNTIIFFIGDNGRCNIRGKGYLYEPGIRIPMIAWGKGIKKCVVDDMVSSIDISATVLDLAGCELPSYLMGKPLFNKETGESTPWRDEFFAARDNWDEVVECIRSLDKGDFKYIRNYFPDQPWDMHQQYLDFHRPAIHVMRKLKAEGKLDAKTGVFMADKKPVEELYNIKNDPFELVNLAENPEYKSTLEEMRTRMDQWQTEHVDMGLTDRDNRTPEVMPAVREYLKAEKPEEWKYLTDGNVGEKYAEQKKASDKWAKDKKKK